MPISQEIIKQLKALPIEERSYIIATWENQNDDSPAEMFRKKYAFHVADYTEEVVDKTEDAGLAEVKVLPLDSEFTQLVFQKNGNLVTEGNANNTLTITQGVMEQDSDWESLQDFISSLHDNKLNLTNEITQQFKNTWQEKDSAKLMQLLIKLKQTYYQNERWDETGKLVYDLIQDALQSKNWITINNPGSGDCAYYSLAIGLIPYLKQDKDLLWRLATYYDGMIKTNTQNKSIQWETGKEFFEQLKDTKNFAWKSPTTSTEWINTFAQLMRFMLTSNAKISIQQILKESYSDKMLNRLNEISMLKTAIDAFYNKANKIVFDEREKDTLNEDYGRLGKNAVEAQKKYLKWSETFPLQPNTENTIRRISLHHLYITALFLLPQDSWSLIDDIISRKPSNDTNDTLIMNALWAMLKEKVDLKQDNPIIINQFLAAHKQSSRYANVLYFPSILEQLSCSHQNIHTGNFSGAWPSMAGGSQRMVNTLDEVGHFQTRFYLPQNTDLAAFKETLPIKMNADFLNSIHEDKALSKQFNINNETFSLQQSFYTACQIYVESNKSDAASFGNCKNALDKAYETLWQYYASGEFSKRYDGDGVERSEHDIYQIFKNWAWDLLAPLNSFLSVLPNAATEKCQAEIKHFMDLLKRTKGQTLWKKLSATLLSVNKNKSKSFLIFHSLVRLIMEKNIKDIESTYHCTMKIVKVSETTKTKVNGNQALSVTTNSGPEKESEKSYEEKWAIKVKHASSINTSRDSINSIDSNISENSFPPSPLNTINNNEEEKTLIEIQSSKKVTLVQGWKDVLRGNNKNVNSEDHEKIQQMAEMLIETYIAASGASKENPKTIRITGQDNTLQEAVRNLIGKNKAGDNKYPFLTATSSVAKFIPPRSLINSPNSVTYQNSAPRIRATS